ncbi:MAG: peptidyl-prolyl cis-trans isomerase B (cyclophilin B), partial [Dokdonia sp.]
MTTGTIKTAKGDMKVEFYDNDAPKTVANFV